MKAVLVFALLVSAVHAGPVADARAKWHAPQAKSAPTYPAYPLRRSNWSYPGNIRAHVLANHSRDVEPAWIAAQSDESLRAFHSDAHEGRVQWAYVVRAVSATPAKAVQSGCPGGVCPTGRPRILQRILGL